LNRSQIIEIYTNGYSRIPVYENDVSNITSILLAMDLLLFYENKVTDISIK